MAGPILQPAGLRKGDALPFFEAETIGHSRIRYADLWQRRNLLLVCLPEASTPADDEYARALSTRAAECEGYGAECVVTRDRVRGVAPPAAIIADRWGEIQYLACSASGVPLPDPQELLDTLDYVQRRCPECEGEWR